MTPETTNLPVGSLEQNAQAAVAALRLRLQAPAEQEVLRKPQREASEAIVKALAAGETAFHIAEATGLGKTAIALQLIQAVTPVLGKDGQGKTIFVSPTIDILKQTQQAAERFAEGITVTNYYAREKNIEGDVINTTYDSLPGLVAALHEKGQDVRLAICDEVHTGQGEVRATAYPAMPHAILLGLTATPDDRTIQRLIADGKITGEERWVQMFRNGVHEIRLAKGIYAGYLSALDMHIVQTSFDATKVTLTQSGEYNQAELEHFLKNRARSLMAVAMVVGREHVTEIEFTPDQQAEIDAVHAKIKGKKTLMFGETIEHVEEVQRMLAERGIKAETYHSKTKNREAVGKNFSDGETQVLLGVRSLGTGVDFPDAEVGIFMVPRQSAIDVEQELGRIMRFVPGKRAIAIQLLDFFEEGAGPVLLLEVLDPEDLDRIKSRGAVRSGSRRTVPEGAERTRHSEDPIIVSGLSLDINTIFEHIAAEQLVRTRLRSAKNIEELAHAIQKVVQSVQDRAGTMSQYEQYQAIAQALPSRLVESVQTIAYEAAMGEDDLGRELGKQTLLFLNMKTILSVVNKYAGEIKYLDKNELMQEAVVTFLENYMKINRKINTSLAVYQIVDDPLSEYIANELYVDVVGWIRQGWYEKIRQITEEFIQQEVTGDMYDAYIGKIRRELPDYKGSENALLNYLDSYDKVNKWFSDFLRGSGRSAIDIGLVAEIMVDRLSERERLVLQMRFGLGDFAAEEKPIPYEECGKQLDVTRERIRQIEAGALAKLRHPESIGKLRHAW